MSTFLPVATLPEVLRRALVDAEYGRKDIAVEASPTFSFQASFGEGFRAFAVAVNLETGDTKRLDGSWGGASINHTSQVDGDHADHVIPVNGAIILGQVGGGRPVSARIILNPENVAKLLPAVDGSVTDRDRDLLAIFGSIKSSYRKEYLDRAKATPAEVDSLISRGLLSRNKAGSVAITTTGKNARGNRHAM
jgi:hypothetical protein